MIELSPHRAASNPAMGAHVFENALPSSLFDRVASAVRATGGERLKRNYTTTFWFAMGAAPRNVAEDAIVDLLRLANPGPDCVGVEWWLGRLPQGKKLRFHFDRDMTLRKETGQFVHPILASILYLNLFPSSPTVILDQVPGPDGESRIPEKPGVRAAVDAVPNRYLVFPGNLRHGVRPRAAAADDPGHATSELRLTLLVNYWDRRPLPPMCRDYDGSIYPSLQHEAARPLAILGKS